MNKRQHGGDDQRKKIVSFRRQSPDMLHDKSTFQAQANSSTPCPLGIRGWSSALATPGPRVPHRNPPRRCPWEDSTGPRSTVTPMPLAAGSQKTVGHPPAAFRVPLARQPDPLPLATDLPLAHA